MIPGLPQENIDDRTQLDQAFMKEALAEARRSWSAGEVPVGAIVVSPQVGIIGRAHNSPVTGNDPTAHAEILALRKAAEYLENYRLIDCTMYVTIEPCCMCAGALIHARIKRLVYGATDMKSGAVSSLYRVLSDDRLNHQVEIMGGVLDAECAKILTLFFSNKRYHKRRGTEVAVTGSTRNRLVW